MKNVKNVQQHYQRETHVKYVIEFQKGGIIFFWLVIQKLFSVTLSTEKCFMWLQEITAKVDAWTYTAVILHDFVITLPVKASCGTTRKAY